MSATPLESVLNALHRATGSKPSRNGRGWKSRCPAHDDSRPSLSIEEGEVGRVLLYCHAGCTLEAVCQAAGLTPADLFVPSAPSTSTKPHEAGRNGGIRRRDPAKNGKARVFKTAEEALAELARQHGQPSVSWTYTDLNGAPVGLVVRWDRAGDKDIRPIARSEAGWVIGGMPEPRPLYRLPDLAGAQRVYVTEGEKAADAARSVGLIVTTSPHGANSAEKADWTPLADKAVMVLPDNDPAGRRYADAVVAILARLTPAPVVKIIELPDLPESGDAADFVDARRSIGATDPAIRTDIERLADASPTWTAPISVGTPWKKIESFDKINLPAFPTGALPAVLRDWVSAESHATQTPADLPGLLALANFSAAIARRVEVEPRPGWREPVNLFVAVLLEPGNRKSAVFSDAMRPLRELEKELIEAARPTIAREQSERRQAERRLQKLEKTAAEKGDAEAGHEAGELAAELAERPEPVLPRLIVDDATSEKLGMMLGDQGGRIASMSPEGGVFDLMAGLYSKNGIPQFNVYLMGHSGDDLKTDRVSRKSVDVPRPALTCAYAMQPQVIEGLAENPAFRGRGLLARFLYAAPRSWIGSREIAPEPVSDATYEAYRRVIRELASREEMLVLHLTSEASAAFQKWEAEIEAMLGDGGTMELMKDWGAKLAGATLRLAAVLHCVEQGQEPGINGATVKAAIRIAQYLVPHAEAVLNMMLAKDDPRDDDARYILRWIERHGRCEFTKSDAQHHGKRRFPRADDIDPALNELVRRGYIRLRPTQATGPGRPPSPTYDANLAVFEDKSTEKRSHYSQNEAVQSERGNSGNIRSALTLPEDAKRVEVTI